MKTKLLPSLPSALRFAATLAAAVATLSAAPLTSTTAVHTRPEVAAPTLTTLPAGTEPKPAVSAAVSVPSGWMAVELAGPLEGWVENKDLTKSLDVKPGAPIRAAPTANAGILRVAEAGNKSDITGYRGKWTQVRMPGPLVGYIQTGSPARTPATTAAQPAPVATAPAASTPPPIAPAPVSPGVYGVASPGQAAPMVNLGDGGSAALPRQFAGRFVSTRRALAPRRPYDYALNDEAGKRYAYLDISKLLLTEQIEKYIDHHVVVFGAARSVPDTKDIVIHVETLRLK